MTKNFQIGDIVASCFEGKIIGSHYLIVDDNSKYYWEVLDLELSQYILYLKQNMEELCQRIA